MPHFTGTALSGAATFFLLNLLIFGSAVDAGSVSTPHPINVSVQPLVIKGSALQPLLGSRFEKWSAFACVNEKPAPVVFQLDDVNQDGQVVPPADWKGERGEEKPGVLDENDEVVMMLRDLGDRCAKPQLSKVPGVIVEVEASAEYLSAPGYVYFTVGERGFVPRGTELRYDAANHRFQSPYYSMTYNPRNPLIFEDLVYTDLNGATENSGGYFDRLKVRFTAQLPGRIAELTYSEEDFDTQLLGFRAGPIRVVRELKIQAQIAPGLYVVAYASFAHYERLWRVSARLRPSKAASFFASTISALFALDFSNLKGLRAVTKTNPEGLLVDGKMLSNERNLDFGGEPWFLLAGRGLNQITVLDLDPNIDAHISGIFIDDVQTAHLPERIRGGMPIAGFEYAGWENLQPRWYTLAANIATLSSFPERGGSGFYSVIHAPKTISVTTVNLPSSGP